ncbi:hypothetical protein WICPIJ_007827 [Wickerhamomyces pijperi]|uniref:Major facilitator superfamily (MFS) profile domain-containing protein n=1 Tax=Wickerhamomyces pijperi TaxID=599730 RepID=A0A9P8TJL2_WICPI|nr:hypothetical protein WICPIJ_007827 [Wickerhamomyces pijperi]
MSEKLIHSIEVRASRPSIEHGSNSSISFSEDEGEVKGVQTVSNSLPFSKSLKLFFTKEKPPKRERPPFFLWYHPSVPSEEKKLVTKIDLFIMTYVCLSYFCRYLDAANVANAYVSGMKEDLKITGAEYIYLSQLFNAAYCFSGLFSTILFTKVRFSVLFPFLEIAWGILTLFIFKAKSFKAVAVLRFFQGLCEGTAWPAIHFILGSWYTPYELGKRTSIFTAAGGVGTILSGLISSGLVKSMEGKSGLKGWQWLFIIDAIITIPIALLGFVVPSSPEKMKPNRFFTQTDIDLSLERIRINGKERINKLDKTAFKRIFTSYQWYLFVIAWCFWSWTALMSSQFGIVLKALGYNVYDRNNIPTAVTGVGIFACLVSGFLIDLRGGRIEIALFLQTLFIIGAIITKIFNVPRPALFFGYMIQGLWFATSPTIVGWCNELTKEDTQLRAVTLGSLNFVSGLIGIPFGIFLFNADFAPEYSKGATANLVLAVMLFLWFILIWQFDNYQRRKRVYLSSVAAPEGVVNEIKV